MKAQCKKSKISKGQFIPCDCPIIKIEDHKPIDGPIEKQCVAWLSCGHWEFTWNLSKKQIDEFTRKKPDENFAYLWSRSRTSECH